jgi:hypothetical protein
MQKNFITISGFLTTCCVAQASFGAQGDVHQHGLVQLNVAIDGGLAVVEMASPAVNLLGFEHAPETEAELLKLEDVLRLLSNYRTLVEVKDGDCSQTGHTVQNPYAADAHDAGPHVHADDSDEQHQEILLRYELECFDEITAIQFEGFSVFSGIEQAVVQWVSGASQGRTTLTPTNRVAPLQ